MRDGWCKWCRDFKLAVKIAPIFDREQQERLVLQALDGARWREMLCWLQHNFSQAELNCTFFRELELVHTCRLTLLACFVRSFVWSMQAMPELQFFEKCICIAFYNELRRYSAHCNTPDCKYMHCLLPPACLSAVGKRRALRIKGLKICYPTQFV